MKNYNKKIFDISIKILFSVLFGGILFIILEQRGNYNTEVSRTIGLIFGLILLYLIKDLK